MDKLARIPSGYFPNQVRQGEIKRCSTTTWKIRGVHRPQPLRLTVCAVALPLADHRRPLRSSIGGWRCCWWFPSSFRSSCWAARWEAPVGAACQRAMAQSREKLNGTTVEFVHGLLPVVKVFNRSLAAFGRFEGGRTRVRGQHQVGHLVPTPPPHGQAVRRRGDADTLLLPAVLIILPRRRPTPTSFRRRCCSSWWEAA